jgi:hypothetical protein
MRYATAFLLWLKNKRCKCCVTSPCIKMYSLFDKMICGEQAILLISVLRQLIYSLTIQFRIDGVVLFSRAHRTGIAAYTNG